MKKLKKMLYIILALLGVIGLGGFIYMQQPQFGKLPTGRRLARIEQSPHYKNHQFQNLSPTPIITTDKSFFTVLIETFINKNKDLSPKEPIPVVKTDLKHLENNSLVWLGHSSYLMKLDGLTYLIDPVFYNASPLPWGVQPFKGADYYKPEDLPEIDFLLITHDHYDHLDYKTIKAIKGKVRKVVTLLGVGEHLEYWGYQPEQITELDWYETHLARPDLSIEALPTRHGSGRTFRQKKTLWGSFMLRTKRHTFYVGGDSGYDTFFKEIAQKYPKIDWAVLENGQYNADWKHIHLLPEDLVSVVKDLRPTHFLAVHNAKFVLARHAWYEPLDRIYTAAETEHLPLATPQIGEVLRLDDTKQPLKRWWRGEGF